MKKLIFLMIFSLVSVLTIGVVHADVKEAHNKAKAAHDKAKTAHDKAMTAHDKAKTANVERWVKDLAAVSERLDALIDGTAGDTDEWVHDGIARPAKRFEQGRDSSGGLAGVWAEENTRAAIFDAMRRRETFATSGPRMQVRFFGGWALPSDLCSAPDLASRGYAQGVPMGGDLAPRPESASPRFVVSAVADPGTTEHPGGLLQRAQIVKVWPGPGDELHQKVVDVAGGPNTASVDLATCTPSGSGATTLCGVWQDPDFDPAQGAAYYARVLENPSCRNTGWACANAGPEDRPAFCARDDVAKRGQERAWTAPIWFTP